GDSRGLPQNVRTVESIALRCLSLLTWSILLAEGKEFTDESKTEPVHRSAGVQKLPGKKRGILQRATRTTTKIKTGSINHVRPHSKTGKFRHEMLIDFPPWKSAMNSCFLLWSSQLPRV